MRVLYLDRNEAFTSVVKEELKTNCGHNQVAIDCPRDVADAINKVKSNVYDIIISEYYHKTEMTGKDFLERLRLMKMVPWSTSFIILTSREKANKDIDKIMWVWELHVDEYLYKNDEKFTPEFLSKRISKLIKKKEALSKIYDLMFQWNFQWAILKCIDYRKYLINTPNKEYIKDVVYLELLSYLELSRYEEVVKLYNFVLEDTELSKIAEYGWFWYFYAKALYKLGKYKEAEKISKQIKQKHPQYLENYELLADIFHADRKNEEAINILQQAIWLSSSNIQRQKYLWEIALFCWELNTAKQAMNSVIQDGKNSCVHSIDDFAHLANIESQLWNFQEALKVIWDGFEKFKKDDPSSKFVTAVIQSQILAKKWDLEWSVSAFKLALDEYKNNLNLPVSNTTQLYFWAECLEHWEVELWKEMIQKWVSDEKRKFALEWHLSKVLRKEESIGLLTKCIDEIWNEWKTIFDIAMDRLKNWDFKKWYSILLEQIKLDKTNPFNYFNVAELLLKNIEYNIEAFVNDEYEFDKKMNVAISYIERWIKNNLSWDNNKELKDKENEFKSLKLQIEEKLKEAKKEFLEKQRNEKQEKLPSELKTGDEWLDDVLWDIML